MTKRLLVLLGLAALLLLSSCASRKAFVYLNDMSVDGKYPFDADHEAVIQNNDRLSITVSCKQPELAIPFNIVGGSFMMSSDGVARAATGSTTEKGYKVDSEGYIDFPILGKIRLSGLTISEARDVIRNRIIEGDYIKAPIVSMEFLNFKYTVLGAVGKNGSFPVVDGKISLLEAIANAGDLTSRARLDRVMVIREENGKKRIYQHDIRSKSIYESPCFYLQQNDLIYVEPKYNKKDTGDTTLQFVTLILSIISSASTVLWAVNSISNNR